ncbi:hypothetical protein ASE92_06520 [Pedobacter sp. Leaf41]|uniref:DUF262 domain-containing protein n=1 Tax=Pedobacter sp. Leaf41 TaxID=1736218 RepID=UPI0007038415|nr:DUF262 domain-containing protein [Pedobacter sp. Leaf41]KQN35795.1 hypothetical protein ASE92_06520 [Pedobacter sp. Leaf41]
MSKEPNGVKTLTITELLNASDNYSIPIYQRNYAWEAKEIEQLIQDVIDYAVNNLNKNYYIGTLVVAGQLEKDNVFSVIDGQQRLTTLAILACVIKNEHEEINLDWFNKLNLTYESRTKSEHSLGAAFNGSFDGENYDVNIKAAYEICKKELVKKVNQEKVSIVDLVSYIFSNVQIIRVVLPKGTDLNHYFEIMNSRGEQLEKHEVLKASLMEVFSAENNANNVACFNLIWEACSNMELYLQSSFATEQRHLIFGQDNWNILAINSFDEFVDKLADNVKNDSALYLSIEQIIKAKTIAAKEVGDSQIPDRFNSVTNFQNFLLHVLRIQTASSDVALDDKRLIELFEAQLPNTIQAKIQFVKDYIFNLLKCKFLYDKYVIKREFTANTDRWSLKNLKWYNSSTIKNGITYANTFGEDQVGVFDGDNRQVIMLLSMFHVSLPAMSYKHWLNAALNYLFHQFEVDSKAYIGYLEHIAKLFVFDRYLAKEPQEYYHMIYESVFPIYRTKSQLELTKLSYHRIENNLVFNFLDYLLWVKYKDVDKDPRVKAFEYTFRSSVEHYYPQNRLTEDIKAIDESHLHSFGNLCLISHDKNSKLSNNTPMAKRDYYGVSSNLDSIKQFLMIKETRWEEKEIDAHEESMIDLFTANLNSEFTLSKSINNAQKWFKEYQLINQGLLTRTLLCFDDYPKNVNGNKYNFLDFDYIRKHRAFQLFEEHIVNNKPKGLQQVIDHFLTDQDLKADYRFLFIKYPEVITYCKKGNFQYLENGKLIYLLEADKNTIYKARELYAFILQHHFQIQFGYQLYLDNKFLYINIGYRNNEYFIAKNREESLICLKFWNQDGTHFQYSLFTDLNGNHKAVKRLKEHQWEKMSNGEFLRLHQTTLVKFGDNYEVNELKLAKAVVKVLKDGLSIKL